MCWDYISAWASALLVQTISGNAKASECRDGQQVQTPALFLYVAIHYLFNPTGPGSLPAKTENAMRKMYLKNLFAAICCTVIPIGMSAQFSGSGSGTKDDPYRIFNADQLNQVRNFAGKTDVYFSLEADIDMTQWIAENNPSQGWQPIGKDSGFRGNFNGNGHIISNLWIKRPSTDYIGLFGKIDDNAEILNLKLENAEYVGNDYVGGIVGYCYNANSITSCEFNGKISGNDYIGGIIGYIDNNGDHDFEVSDCNSYCHINGRDYIGGICGYNYNRVHGGENYRVFISDCLSYSNIDGRDYIGGICGYAYSYSDRTYSNSNITISNCYSYNHINGNSYIGGVSGYNYTYGSGTHSSITISNCYSHNHINGNSNIGGVSGDNFNYDSGNNGNITTSDCFTNGRIKGNESIGGIVGYIEKNKGSLDISKCYSNNSIIEGKNYVGGIFGNSTANNIQTSGNVSLNEVISSDNNLYRIGNKGGFDNNLAWVLTQMLLNSAKQPIPDDSGANGTSTGLSTLKLQATYEGLGWDFADTWQIEETESFPYFKNQTAPPYFQQALKKGDTNLSGQCAEAGTVTVSIDDKVYTVQSSGNTWSLTLDNPLQAGGVVDVWVQAEGKMPSYVVSQTVSLAGGGTESDPFVISTPEDLQAISSDDTENAYYKLANDIDLTEWIETNSSTDGWIPVTLRGTFDGDGHTVSGLWCNSDNGGLFGLIVPGAIAKDIKVSIVDGKAVQGNTSVGGIVADNMGTVTRCMVTGEIEGGSTAGGIAGQNSGSISECYSSGSVVSSMANSKLGGIVGENQSGGKTIDCYSTADITTTGDNSYAAGIAGYNSGTIEKCYAGGSIYGSVVAGICGYGSGAEAQVKNCVAVNKYLSATKSALRILGGYNANANAPATTDNYAFEGMPVSVNNIPQKIYDDPLNGTTKTIDELHTKATYEALGWDMENLWKIDEGSSLPYFEVFSVPVSEISLDKTEATLERQSTLQLTATVLPENCRNNTLKWSSDNEEVATVDENGLVTAVSVGEANITATAVDGSGVTATCKVTVSPKLVTSVTLNKNELTIEKSFTAQLAATVAPDDADDLGLIWTSDNEEVATVDENGLVTAVSVGEANITATAVDGSGVTATCKVTVTPKLVTSVILDESELTIEKNFTEQLTATVAPDDADNLSLTWTSDNEEVATVDENGLVTAVGEGTATITATANDGSGVAASCVVTVTFIDGIADIETSKVTVLAANGRITVSGKEKDDTVSVYDTGGRLLYRGESDVIDVPRKAMYIVTVSGKNYKVIVP